MKLNYETSLVGEKVILVPYRPEHVSNYHEWMKDPALLEATGSEPLTYEEEVEMQQGWHLDENKCTFIVHAREECGYVRNGEFESTGTQTEKSNATNTSFRVENNLDAMIGDVNLFLSEINDDDDEIDANEKLKITELNTDIPTEEGESSTKPLIQAEIDIMIARKDYQGKGLGRAATCTMLKYGATKLGIHRFFCRINEDNLNSIRLFKSIGFQQCGYAACFKQVELELRKPLPEMAKIFKNHGGSHSTIPCDM